MNLLRRLVSGREKDRMLAKLPKRVFVHIDAAGTYVGNGGFVMLASFANEVANMGYETFVFDQENRLKWEDFDWLCWDGFKFEITSVDHVFNQRGSDCVLVTNWLNVLLDRFGKKATAIRSLRKLGGAITQQNLRYWEQSELLRDRYKYIRDFCLKHCSKIAINNRTLDGYYRKMGFSKTIFLENWIRSDLFRFDGNKIANSVGHQPDRGDYGVYEYLVSHFGEDRVIVCEGDQKQVAEKMQMADFYVFFNQPSPAISLFKGEVFGLSLFEAMACGCVCIAREHEGNKFLRGTIPLVKDISEVAPLIESLIANPSKKEEIRARSLKLIETRFRFDDARRKATVEFLR